jgi:hypothetical protein
MLKPDGLMLIGEPFWRHEPTSDALDALDIASGEFSSLIGTLDRFQSRGMTLVEMALADEDSWDRYVAAQWWTVDRWLAVHPDDPEAPEMRRYLRDSHRAHLKYGRVSLGWGVFVLRQDGSG